MINCVSVEVLKVKALIGAFNQEKALVGTFSVITNGQMDLRFKLYWTSGHQHAIWLAVSSHLMWDSNMQHSSFFSIYQKLGCPEKL